MRPAVLFLLCSGLVFGQATIWQIPVWTGRTYQFPRLGPGLAVTNGVLDVVAPAPPVARVYNHTPAPDPAGSYQLPAKAVKVVVYRNGLRQAPGVDYNIVGGLVVPITPGWPDSLVLVDYEPGP